MSTYTVEPTERAWSDQQMEGLFGDGLRALITADLEALKIATDVVAADRAAEEGDLAEIEALLDPKTGALTQIVEENTPPGLHTIIPDIVFRIDDIVMSSAYTGWTDSDAGNKCVRRELWTALKEFGLPISGELFDQTYAYVRENY